MIMFFNLFNKFPALFIILLSYNSFENSNIIDYIEIEIKVNVKSMRIAVISQNSQDYVIQLI